MLCLPWQYLLTLLVRRAELSDEQPFITPESDPTTLLDTTNANQDTLDQTLPEATTDETSASGANTGRQEFPRPPPVAAKDKSLAGKAPANGQELPCLPPTATENKTSARTSNQELSRPPIARHKSSALQALRSMEARIPCRSLLAGEVQVNRAWSGTITTGSFSIVLLATTSFGPLLISIPS